MKELDEKNDKNQHTDMSFVKLQRHIESMHPRKSVTKEGKDGHKEVKQVPFNVRDNLGTLSPVSFLLGETTPMARQLGAGPSLFLLSTKAFAWFFVFLTVLNIPLFRYFYYGNTGESGGFFTDYSLGNVGSSHIVCGVSRYAGVIYGFNSNNQNSFDGNKTINLACKDGAVLGEIIQFGFTKDEKSSCGAV